MYLDVSVIKIKVIIIIIVEEACPAWLHHFRKRTLNNNNSQGLDAECRLGACPTLHSFVHSAYSSSSSHFWVDRTIQSAKGVQQGDPLGPLLFCLSIQHIVTHLELELALFYLDDGSLGGNVDNLKRDLEVVE